MSEEEKNKFAIEYAKQGIDLEKIEELSKDIIEKIKPILNLAIKNRKVLDRYFKSEV